MYDIKDFSQLLGIKGMSDTILKNHFTLYEGYVNNTNKLVDLMNSKEVGTPEFSELHRRFGWEWNGMRLHELYFENLSKEKKIIGVKIKNEIERVWGSFENWEKEFIGMATMRGVGWVMLVKDGDYLFNVWVNEHDLGHLAQTKVLLVMDVFEHAYITDYGIKRIDYINTFIENIDWDIVEKRI